MPSLWRKVIRSRKDHEAKSSHPSSPNPIKEMYQHEDRTTSTETRLHYLNSGQAMQLLRRVHLTDPLQSPSWSGIARSTPESPSILHLIEASTCASSDAFQLLLPGIVNQTYDPSILCIRGLLLDTIKHVGVVIEPNNLNEQSYKPPKWLTKLAITHNSAALREVPLNIAANPSHGSLKSRNSPQVALQEKYDDFMAFLFNLINNQRSPRSPASPKQFKFDDVRMCVTEMGYFGLVPPSARMGDNIFMVERDPLRSIFVVRKHPVHGFYLWNGLVYVHNLAQVVDNTYATDRIMVG